MQKISQLLYVFVITTLMGACTHTTLVESPKTIFLPVTSETTPRPTLYWTSRPLAETYDYLGQVQVRAWSYDGAVERVIQGGQELHADAVIDIHQNHVGFFTDMQAFAIKFKK